MKRIIQHWTIIFYVATACGLIGSIEGAISGGTGAALLGDQTYVIAKISATGIGILGFVEGLFLGYFAVKGTFGRYEKMKANGFRDFKTRVVGYIGYCMNQIVGGVIASLFLIQLYFSKVFYPLILNVSIGAFITGIIITPLVTILSAFILAWAYKRGQVSSC